MSTLETMATLGLVLAGAVVLHNTVTNWPSTAPGGSNSPVNNNSPAGGAGVPAVNQTGATAPTAATSQGNVARGTCEGPYRAGGTRLGQQIFLEPNSQPNCGALTYPLPMYGQKGYIDPSTNRPVDDGITYIVWRCINQITHIDDGYFYLSPFCQGY